MRIPYAKLMIDTKEYNDISYFCFEQTMDYDFYFDVPLPKKDNKMMMVFHFRKEVC